MGRLAGLPVRAHFLSYHHHYQAPQTLRNTLLSTTAPARAAQPLLIICVNQTPLIQHFLNPVDSRNVTVEECLFLLMWPELTPGFYSLGFVHTNAVTFKDVFYVS